MSGTGIVVTHAVLSGGQLRLVATAPAASVAMLATDGAPSITVTDMFGRVYRATPVAPLPPAEQVALEAAVPAALVAEATLPPIPPDADAPSYLLTIGTDSTWFAPVSQRALAAPATRDAVPVPAGTSAIDYTGRDYTTFAAMMRARLSEAIGDDSAWALDHPADPLGTLVDVLAYAGDHLSFRQDAAGTEAYLPTARRRLSLRRHARLRDYAVDDGCTARTALVFAVTGDGLLPARLTAVTYQPGQMTVVLTAGTPLAPSTTVFETMAPLAARVALNDLGPALARGAAFTLPAGAVSCALRGTIVALVPGQLLVFRQTDAPAGGVAFGAQVVRLIKIVPATDAAGDALTLIAWHPEDALTRALIVPPAGQPGMVALYGNVTLADHGASVALAPVPDTVPDGGRYRPFVLIDDPLCAAPPPRIAAGYDGTQDLVAASLLVKSARTSLAPDPREATVCVAMLGRRPGMTVGTPPDLTGVEDVWTARPDLLTTPATGKAFAVALEDGVGAPRRLELRFAEGGLGDAPDPGTVFTVHARDGGGQSGRVQADALRQLIGPAATVSWVTNPLPAAPAEAEPSAAIRLFAANAFRTNLRGVEPRDWELLGDGDPLVTGIHATAAAGGGGPCAIGLDTTAPQPLSFPVAATRLLDRAVLGAPPTLAPSQDVALDIVLVVYCRADANRTATRTRLLQRIGSDALPDGSPAYFHARQWPLGKPVMLADLVRELTGDPAVSFVVTQPEVDPRVRFETLTGRDITANNVTQGCIAIGPHQRARVGNDPYRPQDGSVRLLLVATP